MRSRVVLRASLWGAAAALTSGALVALASPVGLGSMAAVVPVAVVVGVCVVAIKYSKDLTTAAITANRRAIEHRVAASERSLGGRMASLERWLPQAAAAAATVSDGAPFPPPLGGGWALAWDVAGALAREIALGRPATVVELGSGGSSLVIGLQLRRLGAGHLYTLDHEAVYAERTRRLVRAMDLDAWVTVIEAPLVAQQVRGDTYRWYDLPPSIRDLDQVDLLVVDGPPQAIDPTGTPRYPALPMFADRLSATALVFCDDAGRDGEKRTFERWLTEEPGWELEIVETSTGTALLRRAPVVERR